MELWTGALSWWKCHLPDLKSAGLFRPNLFLNFRKNSTFLVDCLSSGNSVHVHHANAVKKRDHQKIVGRFALSGLLGSGRAIVLPLGTLSLGLWVITVDSAFIGHQSIKNCGI